MHQKNSEWLRATNRYSALMRRLIIADDHAIVRHGLRALLEQAGGYAVLAECADVQATRDAVHAMRPDLLVLDIAMPGGNGLQLAAELRDSHPMLRILLYSQYASPIYVAEAQRLGLAGFVSKESVADELHEALSVIGSGGFYLSEDLRGQSGVPGFGALTDKEREVFLLLAQGHFPKQAAIDLGISEKTVYTHRDHIRKKLGLGNDQQFRQLARRIGLLR